jgi:hypothetical protein
MEKFNQSLNESINKAVNKALLEAGRGIGASIGEQMAKQIQATNSKFEDVNNCINSLAQLNFSLLLLLFSSSPELYDKLRTFLKNPPPYAQENDVHYRALVDSLSAALEFVDQSLSRQDGKPPWFRGVVLGQKPSPPEGQDEQP